MKRSCHAGVCCGKKLIETALGADIPATLTQTLKELAVLSRGGGGAVNSLHIPDGSEVVPRPIQTIFSSPNLQLLGRGKQNVGPTGHPRKKEVQD